MRAVVFFCLLLVASPIAARAEGSQDHDRAVAIFEEGRRFLDQGNRVAAIGKFTESLRYEASVGARLSLADCYSNTDPLAAWRHLREAARLAYLRHDERFEIAQKRAAELEPKLTRIHIAVPSGALEEPGFEVRVDGVPVDPFFYKDGVLAVEPGKHLVEAVAPRRHFSQMVATENGSTPTVQVALENDVCSSATPSTAVAAPASTADTGSTQRALGVVSLGLGAAGIALGAVFGFVTLGKKSDLASACGGNTGACSASPGSLDAEREAARAAATVSTVSFIVGGVGLASGAALYLTAPSARAQTGNVRVRPFVGQAGAGFDVVGRF
jgi:hypothetical protein